jgi:uncharacterized membrane protein HdeD (DUF308 family)
VRATRDDSPTRRRDRAGGVEVPWRVSESRIPGIARSLQQPRRYTVLGFEFGNRETAARSSRYWWLFVLAGISWMVFALIVFRFNWASVIAVAVLFGTIAIAAGVLEFAAAAASAGGWRLVRYVLGVIFIAIGVVALFTPGGTFAALAAVVSFFFVFAGSFDIVAAFAARSENSSWWFQLLMGIAEVALGFWAAGNWTRSVVLLVAWVAASAMFRGVAMIITGFTLRGLRHELDAVEGTEARERGRQAPELRYGH